MLVIIKFCIRVIPTKAQFLLIFQSPELKILEKIQIQIKSSSYSHKKPRLRIKSSKWNFQQLMTSSHLFSFNAAITHTWVTKIISLRFLSTKIFFPLIRLKFWIEMPFFPISHSLREILPFSPRRLRHYSALINENSRQRFWYLCLH